MDHGNVHSVQDCDRNSIGSQLKMKQIDSVLYYDEVSPPVRFVLMTMKCLNLQTKLKYVDLFASEQKSEDFKRINPLYTVPTLVIGDFQLTDSHAICTYLVNEYAPDSTLYPQNPLERAKVDKILCFNNSIFFPRQSAILQSPFDPNRPAYSKMLDKFMESVGFLDTFCQNTKWLAGDNVTLADLCCIATYSTAKLLVHIESGKYRNVDDWEARCKSLPVYSTVNVPGLQTLKKGILKFGNIDHIDKKKDEIMKNLLI